MKFFTELAHLCRFKWRTPEKDKRIVFYAEHAGYYPNFEGLVRELTGKRGATLCYVTSDPQDPILNRPRPGVHTFYISKLLPFFMQFVNCRVAKSDDGDARADHFRPSSALKYASRPARNSAGSLRPALPVA